VTQSTSEMLTIRESRWIPWLVLPVFAGLGVLLLVQGNFVIGTIFLLSAICGVLALGPGTVVTVDPLRASVVIKRRSFFRPPVLTEIPFNDIASVAIEQYPGSKGGKLYKLVLVRQTGEHTALLDSSSSELSKYKQQGQQINALLGAKDRPVPIVEPKISDRLSY
jgi:hypothetical protein